MAESGALVQSVVTARAVADGNRHVLGGWLSDLMR